VVVQVAGLVVVVVDGAVRRGLFWGKEDQSRLENMMMKGMPKSTAVMKAVKAMLTASCSFMMSEMSEKGRTRSEGGI
jgi:hypothetical protein